MNKFLLLFFLSVLISCSSTSKKDKNIIKAPELPEEEILGNGISTYDQGLYKVSLKSWTDLRDGYPTSYYSTLAEIKIADAQFFSGDFPTALVAYEEFTKLHPGHESMPYIRYQIANCHMKQYRDVKHDQGPLQSAIKAFEQLIVSHPRSEYIILARRKLQLCREYQAEYEKYVADFYTKRGLETAASFRLQRLSDNYPEFKAEERLQSEKQEKPKASGALPAAPQLIHRDRALDYSTALSALPRRPEVSEQSILEEDFTSSKSESVSDSVITSSALLSSFECEEVDNGTLFTANLSAPVTGESVGDLFKPTVPNPNLITQSEHCSAGGMTVKVTVNQSGLRLLLPTDSTEGVTVLQLNRPSRLVLLIQK